VSRAWQGEGAAIRDARWNESIDAIFRVSPLTFSIVGPVARRVVA
jgi:RES domain-containing protein